MAVTVAQRKTFAKAGVAMPDGSYYIRNASDLQNAIDSVGRGNASHDIIRKHCIARAKALGLTSMIPANWNPDGSLKHDSLEDVLVHFGIKGMRWGVRTSTSGGSSRPVSADAARAHASASIIKRHGTSALSNQDLQHLVTRLNLEKQHGQLNQKTTSHGEKIVKDLVANAAKQQAQTYVNKYAAKGTEKLIKLAAKAVISTGKHAFK